MDNIIIRKAKLEDVIQISEIVVEDWKIVYKDIIDSEFLDSMNVENQYQKEIERYTSYIVATNGNNEVLGYAWQQELDDDVADCEIVALYIKYSYRGNGIGKKLLLNTINYFRKLGKRKMIIWCLKDNYESRKFYEKMGGKEFKLNTHKWGKKEYEIISYIYDLENKLKGVNLWGK